MRIDGHWVGHYRQDAFGRTATIGVEDGLHPIEAWMECDGQTVSGRMTDLDPVQERPFSEFVASLSDSMGWWQRMSCKAYLLLHPRSTLRVSLFPESRLEGSVAGDQVSFTKTYGGPSECVVRNGNSSTKGTQIKVQPILYQGQLSPEGDLIIGTYELPLNEGKSKNQTFELRRVPES